MSGAGFETPAKREEEFSERLGKLEQELKRFREVANTQFIFIRGQLDRHSELLATIAQGLQRSGGFTAEDIGKLIKQLASSIPLEKLKAENPLSPDEQGRLNYYLQKAQQGLPFPEQEAWDFRELSRRARDEHPDDSLWWALATLGAFVFGLSLGKKLFEPSKKEK